MLCIHVGTLRFACPTIVLSHFLPFFFNILPVAAAGNDDIIMISHGRLYGESRAAANATISTLVNCCPGFNSTKATTSSFSVTLRPTTADCNTAGWLMSTASTFTGYTLKPDRIMTSLVRPTINNAPSESILAISPVLRASHRRGLLQSQWDRGDTLSLHSGLSPRVHLAVVLRR